ncbi:MAG: helix-turn-helix domain-containing protein [Gammaproteobacteria bacterium]|nr:helix-turn-helix domain-containing protein [Gammaproteobacteria bacterium]
MPSSTGTARTVDVIDEQDLFSTVGKRIRDQRKRAKLTQAKLAEFLHLERTSITNIEKGLQKPPLGVLYQLCAHLNLSLTELLPPLEAVLVARETATESVTVGSDAVELPPKTASVVRRLSSRGS